MAEEDQVNDPAVETGEPAVEPWQGDFDAERSQRALLASRNDTKVAKANAGRYRKILHDLGINTFQLHESIGAGAEPDGEDSTLATIAAMIGADAANPQSIVEGVKQARLSGELYTLFEMYGVDPALTRAVINSERLLATVDVTASDLNEQLTTIVQDVAERHPALTGKQQRARALGPNTAEKFTNDAPPVITQDDLRYMNPDAIVAARQAGLLTHLNVSSSK